MNLVIKRNGTEVPFDEQKIASAIKKAGFVKEPAIYKIIEKIKYQLSIKGSLTVEEIQDLVELGLMTSSYKSVAREYIRYRKTRELIRENEKANESILKLIDDKNEYLKTENSNKNHRIASTQRDYIAGEVSKDISTRLLLPTEVVEAHKKGVIHMHDLDYFIQHIHNCSLINLEDILQNGTVINGTLIEKPHSFSTACNIATQVAAIIASNQYGGQTMSLAHLAPFVEVSRQRIKQEAIADGLAVKLNEEALNEYVEEQARRIGLVKPDEKIFRNYNDKK